jgi:hypothetical protein
MTTPPRPLLFLSLLSIAFALRAAPPPVSVDAGVAPGSVYREHTLLIDKGWRVTDPDVRWTVADKFLPNPALVLPDVKLEHAVGAELILDYWHGHPGTRDKVVRLNRRKWMPLAPQFEGLRGLDPLHVSAQMNLRLPVPLGDLVEGDNTLQGSCGDNPHGWGQWGWFAAQLRVHLDPALVSPRVVEVKAPEVLSENPTFTLRAERPEEIAEVRYVARYLGVDENGDGRLDDFHGMMRKEGFEGHVGTATEPPFAVTWDTTWVPDQKPGAIAVQALVRDRAGVWTASPVLEGLSLPRTGHSVRIYRPVQQIAPFTVRNNGVKSAVVFIPMDTDMARATEARVYVRTFNGKNHELGYSPMRVNASGWLDVVRGTDHYFHAGLFEIDPRLLLDGDNQIAFHSTSKHHGPEILWPGPLVLVRFGTATPVKAKAGAADAAGGH